MKMTGIFEGKLGTKRFCSSRDWGYYCEYIKRPGDIQVRSQKCNEETFKSLRNFKEFNFEAENSLESNLNLRG